MNKRLDGDFLILYYFDESGETNLTLRKLVDDIPNEVNHLTSNILCNSIILKRTYTHLKADGFILSYYEFADLIHNLLKNESYRYVTTSVNDAVRTKRYGINSVHAFLFQFDTYEFYKDGVYQQQFILDEDYINGEVDKNVIVFSDYLNSDNYKRIHELLNVEKFKGNNTVDLKTDFIITYNVNGVPVNEIKSHKFTNIDLTDFDLINELIKYELYVLDYSNIKVDNATNIGITINNISVNHKEENINEFKTLTDFNKYYGIKDNLKENAK